MEDYIKPTVKLSPKQIILICGTNNLPSSEIQKPLQKTLLLSPKTSKLIKIPISGIIPRRDTFNLKAKQVNETLKKICEEEKIPFISRFGINTSFHLNSRGLHLSKEGATQLSQNFKILLSDI